MSNSLINISFFFMPIKQTADGMYDKYAIFQ